MKKAALFFRILATGTISVLFTACYGTIQAMYGVPSSIGGIIRTVKRDNTPVPGIKVSYKITYSSGTVPDTWNNLGQTGATGQLEYEVACDPEDTLSLKVEDLDGQENGGDFVSQILIVDESSETVTLEEEAL